MEIDKGTNRTKTRICWIAGCLNGGGQIKPRAGQSAKDLIQHLESVYMKDVRNWMHLDCSCMPHMYRLSLEVFAMWQ